MKGFLLSLVVFVVFYGVLPAGASEWDCASTSGTFERSTDCTMGDEVAVSGDLTVTGKETVYSTLTAASGKRHFKITSGAHTLALKWLNMTGGDVTSGLGDGGSIYIFRVAAHLNISRSVFFNNRADLGGAVYGAVYAEDARPTLLFSSVLVKSNYATDKGGGVYLKKGTFNGESNTFKKNTAGDFGGAMSIQTGSTVSSTDSTFRKNTAEENIITDKISLTSGTPAKGDNEWGKSKKNRPNPNKTRINSKLVFLALGAITSAISRILIEGIFLT